MHKSFFSYVHERDGEVDLEAINKPKKSWSSPLEVFSAALKHEQHISSRINDIVDIALSEKDHATNNFLQWFVAEQVEEEATASGIVQQIKMLEGSKQALFMLDREMGQRTFVDSTNTEG
jgi:ferritin